MSQTTQNESPVQVQEQESFERRPLMRSESIFQRHDLQFDFSSEEDEEEGEGENNDSRSNSSHMLAAQEEEADAQQDIFRKKKMLEFNDYEQVMQISVECIKSSWTYTGYGVICIERSAKANEIYIYIPLTGNVYTIKNDHTLSFSYLLDYILYTTPEFVDYGKGKNFEFALDGYQLPDKAGYCETPTDEETEKFFRLPLDEVPLSQASLRLSERI
jgi:hypothetical protein